MPNYVTDLVGGPSATIADTLVAWQTPASSAATETLPPRETTGPATAL